MSYAIARRTEFRVSKKEMKMTEQFSLQLE